MKNKLFHLLLIILFSFNITGCNDNTIKNGTNNDEKNEVTENTNEISGVDVKEDSNEVDKTNENNSSKGNDKGTENKTKNKTENNKAESKNDNVSNTNNTTSDNKDSNKNVESNENNNTETGKENSNESPEQTLTSEELKAKKIVDKIIKPSMSDFNKALAIHDWLTFNIDYDHSYSVYTVEGTLSKKVAVCEGYARTFKIMAELAGLEAEMVTGYTDRAHAWNQVKINGVWYNVDVTWDDPTQTGKKTSDHSNNNYNYFLISDSTIKKDHKPNSTPHSCSKDYDRRTILKAGLGNGYRSNHGYAETQADANSIIKKMVEKGYNEFYIWYYDSSVTKDNSSEKIINLIKTTPYPVAPISSTLPVNGVTIYKLKPTISLSEWKNISIAKTSSEFADIINSKIESGNKNFMIRYELTDGTIDRTKIKYSYKYSVINYGSSYQLFTITLS